LNSAYAEFKTSANAKVGEPLWPAPHRYFPTDGIMDHVFEERMTVLYPVAISADARPGDEVTISADLSWLVCERICLPESATLSLRVPVAADTPPSDPRAAEAFREARARLPRPLKEDDPIQIGLEDQVLRIRAMGSRRVAFYPSEDSRRARRLIEQGETEGELLEIEFRESDEPIRGVLELWPDTDSPTTLIHIEWPRPAPGAAPEAGS
jgi:thiol:disulfide interchange protein DsbD